MEQAKRQAVVDLSAKRRLCVLEADSRTAAVVRDICLRSAFLATSQRPPLGATVALHHGDGGTVHGRVSAHAAEGIAVALPGDSRAAGFALAVIAAGMGRT